MPSSETSTTTIRPGLWTLLFALLVGAWLGFFFSRPEILPVVGVGHYRIEVSPRAYHEIWFLDTLAILASNDTAAAGEDPYAPNRRDYLQRPHVYGPPWLLLRHVGLTLDDVIAVGASLGGLFVLAVTFVLRPRSPGALGASLAFFCTTPVLAAIERANNDLVVFLLLTPCVPCLLSRHVWVRSIAVGLVVLAAALKYYPAVAGLVLLAPAATRELRGRVGAAVVLLAGVALMTALLVPRHAMLPAPRGVLTFGAASLFHELGVEGAVTRIVPALAGVLLVVFWWRTSWLREWSPREPLRRAWLYFVLGGVILTACFFVGQHFAYRWVFALWLVPLLLALRRDITAPASVRRLARTTTWLLVAMLWLEAVFIFAFRDWEHEAMMRALHWVALGMQPLTWAFFGCVLGFLVHFARHGLAGLLGRERPFAAGGA